MNRILVVVPNWFGEALFVTPFIQLLAKKYPAASIAVLGWPQAMEVLRENPAIHAFIVYDEKSAHRSVLGKWRLAVQLRAHHFDAAFILRRSLSRSLIVAMTGIPQRIGFANPKSGWLLTHRIRAEQGPVHKANSYLPLLTAVGARPEKTPYTYRVSSQEADEAQVLLTRQNLNLRQPIVFLHAGANWPHKRWPAECFAALGDRLFELGYPQRVLTGGGDDRGLVSAIGLRMRHPAVVLAGQTTIRQLAACLKQASLLVANDTGVLHIAAALERPVIALYGPTSPTLTGPLGKGRMRVVHHPDCCPEVPCYHPSRPPHAGMTAISVEEVFNACRELLG